MRKLPEHLFLSECGDLHDTRTPNWSRTPLRTKYSYGFPEIETVAQFKATLRHGPYAWPGGYPLFFICSDGEALSFEAARANASSVMTAIRENYRDGWQVVGCTINYEDPELYCAHTGKRIESAYAEPENDAQSRADKRNADHVDGYDRDDLGESPDY